MKGILNPRWSSPLLLTAVLGIVFWLRPGLTPEMFGATTPASTLMLATGLFLVGWFYLVTQGYPIAHGNIGSASAHTWDNIVSMFPGVAALFGIFLTLTNLWPLSQLNLVIASMVAILVLYDLWIIGGAASKINRLTDEIKAER